MSDERTENLVPASNEGNSWIRASSVTWIGITPAFSLPSLRSLWPVRSVVEGRTHTIRSNHRRATLPAAGRNIPAETLQADRSCRTSERATDPGRTGKEVSASAPTDRSRQETGEVIQIIASCISTSSSGPLTYFSQRLIPSTSNSGAIGMNRASSTGRP